MVLFEFILVMVSLVLAIGVTHLLQGVVEVVRYRETLELYWVPFAWAATLFVLAAGHWWSLWDMRGVEWTFPGFFFLLLPPHALLCRGEPPCLRGYFATRSVDGRWL